MLTVSFSLTENLSGPSLASCAAREALHVASDLKRGVQTRLSLVHVIPDVWAQAWVAEAGVDLPLLEHECQEDARKQLRALIIEEKLTDVGVETAVLAGTPHIAIIKYATEQHADLIVMGAHGHGPVRRFLLGSVAERMVRAARCPVLTVPHFSLRGTDGRNDGPETVGAANQGDVRPNQAGALSGRLSPDA